jgi:hypothetical protein
LTPLRGRRAAAPPAPFVVGVGRSGTTLLRLMLDAHPQLAIPPETHFVPALIERAGAGAGASELAELIVASRGWDDFGLSAHALHRRFAELGRPDAAPALRAFYGLCAEARDKPRWGDKTPAYVTHMGEIAGVLAEARFVHLVRDGRDVALSRRRRGMGAGKPMTDTARLWRRRIEGARRQARRLRGRYLELRYEDLVADAEPALRAICDLIELDYDPSMLAYHERAGDRLAELGDLPAVGPRRARSAAERRSAHALAQSPPVTDRAGGWRKLMSAADRAEFEAEAGELLAELGYDVPS